MRVLVLSDIHGNLEAMRAVVEAAPSFDAVWNLGDLIGYGPEPNEVIERARALGSVFVRGNHERAAAGLLSLSGFNPVAARAASWTVRQLTADNAKWIRSLSKGPIVFSLTGVSSLEDEQITCVHGSILDEDEYLLSIDDAIPSLRRASTRISFFGHTHVQGGFATNGEDWFTLKPDYAERDIAESWELQLRVGARYLINPGSVGQPRDSDWRAAFAIFDVGRQIVEFHRTPYDVKTTQKHIQEAGLPDWLASRLVKGR